MQDNQINNQLTKSLNIFEYAIHYAWRKRVLGWVCTNLSYMYIPKTPVKYSVLKNVKATQNFYSNNFFPIKCDSPAVSSGFYDSILKNM